MFNLLYLNTVNMEIFAEEKNSHKCKQDISRGGKITILHLFPSNANISTLFLQYAYLQCLTYIHSIKHFQ